MPAIKKNYLTEQQLNKYLPAVFPFLPRYPYLIPVGIQWLMPVQTKWNNGKNCSVQAIINQRAVFTYNMVGSICLKVRLLDAMITAVRKRYDVKIYREMLEFKNKAGNKPKPGDKSKCAYMTSYKGKLVTVAARNKEACNHYNIALTHVGLRDAYMAYYYSKKVGMLKKSLAPIPKVISRYFDTKKIDRFWKSILGKTSRTSRRP